MNTADSIYVEDVNGNIVYIGGHAISVPDGVKFGKVLIAGAHNADKLGKYCSYGENTGHQNTPLLGLLLRRIDAEDVEKVGFYHT